MSAIPVPAHDQHDPKRDTRFAWLSLLLYPISFFAAFVIGEGLATWLFGWPDNPDPPVWQMLIAAVPALVVFALPAIPAWHFGMRAHRNGSQNGRVAAWVAVGIGAGFLVMNVVPFLIGKLLGL